MLGYSKAVLTICTKNFCNIIYANKEQPRLQFLLLTPSRGKMFMRSTKGQMKSFSTSSIVQGLCVTYLSSKVNTRILVLKSSKQKRLFAGLPTYRSSSTKAKKEISISFQCVVCIRNTVKLPYLEHSENSLKNASFKLFIIISNMNLVYCILITYIVFHQGFLLM